MPCVELGWPHLTVFVSPCITEYGGAVLVQCCTLEEWLTVDSCLGLHVGGLITSVESSHLTQYYDKGTFRFWLILLEHVSDQ